MTAELLEALTPLVGSAQASSMASSLTREPDPLEALNKVHKKLLDKSAVPLYPLVRVGQLLLKITAQNRLTVFKNTVNGLRTKRANQRTGSVEPFPEGVAILSAVIEIPSSGNPVALMLNLGSILNFKNFGDNTWKQDRETNMVTLVVDDSANEFNPFDEKVSATGPVKARNFAARSAQLIVVIDSGGDLKHLYTREGDPVGSTFAASAASLWPRIPAQAYEIVPNTSGRTNHCGPWRIIDSDSILGKGASTFEISFNEEEARNLFPNDIILFAEDSVAAPYGIGRLHHFHWSEIRGKYHLVLDRFSLIPPERDKTQEEDETQEGEDA